MKARFGVTVVFEAASWATARSMPSLVVVTGQPPADDVLTVGQVGLAGGDQVLEAVVATAVADDTGVERARFLGDGRELLGRQASKHLDEVVAGLDLAPDRGARGLDAVEGHHRLHPGRVAVQVVAGEIEAGAEALAGANLAAPSKMVRHSPENERRRDAVGRVEGELIRVVDVDMGVDEAGKNVATGALDDAGGRAFEFGDGADRRDLAVIDPDRLPGMYFAALEVHDLDVAQQ